MNETSHAARTELEQLMADKGTRFNQHLIDAILFFAVFLAYVFTMEALFGVHEAGNYSRPIGGLLLYLSYYAGSEILFSKTPGKFYCKTKVVDRTGERPAVLWFLVRNLARLIPFDSITYLLDKRGWHDQISRTYVILDRK